MTNSKLYSATSTTGAPTGRVSQPISLPDGHQVEIFEKALGYYASALEALAQAKFSIYFESYIFEGEISKKFAEALAAAAKRGVKVRVLVDGIGSMGLDPKVVKSLVDVGVLVLVYRPIKYLRLFSGRLVVRLHRKIIVIDATTAYVGGINVSDDHLDSKLRAGRLDYTAKITGPVVKQIQKNCHELSEKIRLRRRHVRFSAPSPFPNVDFAVRDNTLPNRRRIEHAYWKAIQSARTEIIIANAYFLPDRKFRRLLVQAARRGVKVTLLLQGMPEFRWVKLATESLYSRLLKQNIKIFEYQPCWLHAKVAVVDRSWGTIGSFNLDPISVFVNLEANLNLREAQAVGVLHDMLEHQITKNSKEISYAEHHARPWTRRFLSRVVGFFVRYGKNRLVNISLT